MEVARNIKLFLLGEIVMILKKEKEKDKSPRNFVRAEVAEDSPSLMLQSKRHRTKPCLHSTRSGYWSLRSILRFCVL